MKTLFISTYNELLVIGLLEKDKLISKKETKSEKSNSSFLMPMINEILTQNNFNPNDLNEIIVVNGPGSFTGVRLGVTVAKTLGFTLNIPIKTITSIESMAISDSVLEKKMVALNSGKGYFYGLFIENKLVDQIEYLDMTKYQSMLKTAEYCNLYELVDNELDIEKISEYLKNKESINPHFVNPIYIKVIDALK